MKRFVIFALLILFLGLFSSAYAMKSREEALTWLLQLEAGKSYEYDGCIASSDDRYGCYAQCVDLIRKYVDFLNGLQNTAMRGNAKDYTSNSLPVGFKRIQKGTPRAGDIIVWTYAPNGHVAIVNGVAPDCITVTEQNYTKAWDADKGKYVGVVTHTRVIYPATDNYWGIIRPDFDIPSITVAVTQNRTPAGYDVLVCAKDDTDVSLIKIGTWHSGMNIDDAIWQDAVPAAGQALFHVDFSQFGNPSGVTYYTNAYAYDAVGRVSDAAGCAAVADLGDEFLAYIIQDSSNGYLQNSGYKIITGPLPGGTEDSSKAVWRFRKQKDGMFTGSYEITCMNNQRCMDIESYGETSGTGINLLEPVGNTAQRFYIYRDNREFYPRYFFGSVYCSCALDVSGSGTVQLWAINYSGAQIFRIETIGEPDPGLTDPDFILPSSVTEISQEAFANCSFETVKMYGSVTKIGSKAFAGCKKLRQVEIPSSVTSIADNAFEDCTDKLVILCAEGSAAHTYAVQHGIRYVFITE